MVGESFQSLLQQVDANDEGRYREILQKLTETVNFLIVHHFDRLVQLLYTVDVNEQQLKQALANNTGKDAAQIIAEMVLQRQIQKVITRQKLKGNSSGIPDEERW